MLKKTKLLWGFIFTRNHALAENLVSFPAITLERLTGLTVLFSEWEGSAPDHQCGLEGMSRGFGTNST